MKYYMIPDRKNIEDSLELASKHKLGFEIQDFFLPSILDSSAEIRKIMAIYSHAALPEMNLHGAFLDVTIHSEDKQIYAVSDKRVTQCLEIASELGAKSVIFHTNIIPNFTLQSYVDNWVARNQQYWLDKLERYRGLNIYIENMFDSSPMALLSLADKMQDESRFGICFDYAHATVFGNAAPLWSEMFSKHIKYVHINDNDLLADLHQAVGQGKINWTVFADCQQRHFPDAPILLEVNGIEKTEASLNYLNQLYEGL